MANDDHQSLEHVHNKWAHAREVKLQKRLELEQREDLADLIHDGYYNYEE